jgi:hypothetical protein
MNPQDNAFPMVVTAGDSEAHNGLTKREYFAVLIYSGMKNYDAQWAVQQADELLAELSKPTTATT